MTARIVDLEDPAYKGKSMARIEKEVWEKDVAALKALGVNLKANHMDGYLFEAARTEEIKDPKPWEISPQDGLPRYPAQDTDINSWKNDKFLFTIEKGVAYMTINRPGANNTIEFTFNSGISDAMRILQNRPDARICTLTGAGRMFCAGGDPKGFQAAQNLPKGAVDVSRPPSGPEITGETGYDNRREANVFAGILFQMANLPQFTIACVNGSAMGGGIGLCCICDMVVAVKQAYFTLSEVRLGVIPATISPHVIGKIGCTNAKRLFCAAENIKAADAVDFGLVQHVVDKVEDFQPIIQKVADVVRQGAPGALKNTKDVLLKVMNAPLSNELLEFTVDQYAKCRKDTEAETAMKALSEKKKPAWLDGEIVVRASIAGV